MGFTVGVLFMDILILLVAAVVGPVLAWWFVKFCLKMIFSLVKLAAIGGLAVVAAYLTFSQAEFPVAPSEEARNVVRFLEHHLSEQAAQFQMPKLKVDLEWPETAEADERLGAGKAPNSDSRYF